MLGLCWACSEEPGRHPRSPGVLGGRQPGWLRCWDGHIQPGLCHYLPGDQEKNYGGGDPEGEYRSLQAPFLHSLTEPILWAPSTQQALRLMPGTQWQIRDLSLPSRTCRAASPARTQAAFSSASCFPLVCLSFSFAHLPVHLSVHFCCADPIWKQMMSHGVWAAPPTLAGLSAQGVGYLFPSCPLLLLVGMRVGVR